MRRASHASLRPGPTRDLLARLPSRMDLAVVADGPRTVVGLAPEEIVTASGADALDLLDRMDRGWWAGFLSYDLGRSVESVDPHALDDPRIPDLVLARFDARMVWDPSAGARIEGDGASRPALERLLRSAPAAAPMPSLGGSTSSLERPAFEERVRCVLGLIAEGQCYQVNLTRRIEWEQPADPLGLAQALASANPAPHAALLRLGDTAVVSASPERFLRLDGDRVMTRPIKGTARSARALLSSAKDRAENVMIVDLARNDLGRVARPGTVRVPALCAAEPHPGLWHLVSTVTARLRPDVGLGRLVQAAFPPASVTGAPKPRVMQIIEDLEPVRRGVYCGAVGWIDADRSALDLAVAIRTFTITAGRTFLGVGAGIVADSDPTEEWRETELKASRLLEAAGAGAAALDRPA